MDGLVTLRLELGDLARLFRSFALALAVVLSFGVFLPPPDAAPALLFRLSWLVNPMLIFFGFFVATRLKLTGRHVLIGWILSFILTPLLLRGFEGSSLLPSVETSLWGGLLVTLILAIGGLLLAFPIGILLALGRRSTLPMVRYSSVIVIEAVRGVPLITILFMTSHHRCPIPSARAQDRPLGACHVWNDDLRRGLPG